MIPINHITQQQQNIYYCQTFTEHVTTQTIYWTIETNLNKFKIIEEMQSVFSDQKNQTRNHNRNIKGKMSIIWKLNTVSSSEVMNLGDLDITETTGSHVKR